MPARKSLTELLGSVGLFEGLSKRELAKIEKLGKEVSFPSGKTIVKEGDDGVGFHLVLEGKAKVSVRGRSRSTLGPGAWFGELSLIDRGPRTATVTSQTDVRTFSLLSWEFMALLNQDTKISRKILIEMCHRLRDVDSGAHTH